MAYSNYGAFVWKNSNNIDDIASDKTYYYKDRHWNLAPDDYSFYESEESNKLSHVGSHAIVQINKSTIIEFYKTHTINIYFGNNKISLDVEKDVINVPEYKNRNITILGYPLNQAETIFFYEITYKKDSYCVIIGSSIGKGYDDNHVSKFIKRRLKTQEDSNGRITYLLDDSYGALEHAIRKDDIAFERYLMIEYAIKPMLKHFITFKWKYIHWYLRKTIYNLKTIHYLK